MDDHTSADTRRFRLAVVVPRYGPEIGGGIEALARMYATRLAGRMDVTVLTTCALDYRTWRDHHPPGESRDGGVTVRRFPVPRPRDEAAFDAHSLRVLPAPGRASRADQERWMDLQGPNSPALLDHLREHGSGYDAVLFMPYLYATTVRGIPLVADRAVMQPAVHDEPPLALPIFDDAARHARGFVFNTPEERARFVARFGRGTGDPVVGAGIDPPPVADAAAARRAVGVEGDYVLYLGRVDPSKGVGALLRAHERLVADVPDAPALVLAGGHVMDLPPLPWLRAPGFVDDETKHGLLAGALAVVTASPFESLSLVLLEAWSHGRPTVCAAGTDVLVGQTRRAGGGLWFADPDEYVECIDLLMRQPPVAWALGHQGRGFAAAHAWPDVLDRLEAALRAAAPTR